MIDDRTVPDAEETASTTVSRRDLLAGAVGAIGGAVLAGLPRVTPTAQTAAVAAPDRFRPMRPNCRARRRRSSVHDRRSTHRPVLPMVT